MEKQIKEIPNLPYELIPSLSDEEFTLWQTIMLEKGYKVYRNV